MKMMVYGLFGGDNFGDELFSRVIVDKINSCFQGDNPFLFTGNEGISRGNVSHFRPVEGFPPPKQGLGKWARAFSAYRSSQGLLFGGGGLFNEVFLRASIPLMGIVLTASRLFNVPYIIHGVEIGYVGSSPNRYITNWSLRHASRIIFRNQQSVDRARQMAGVDSELGVDLNHGWLHEQMHNLPENTTATKQFVVNLQHSLHRDDPTIIAVLTTRRAEGYRIVFLANNAKERDQILTKFDGFLDEVILATTVEETIAVLKRGDAFLTERFHFTMAALHSNRPTHVVISSTKVRELVEGVVRGGANIEVGRENESERPVHFLPGSAAQADTVADWSRRSDQQLSATIESLQHKRTGKEGIIQWQHLPTLLGFYGMFAFFYLLDRYRPLKLYLDLGKT